MSDITVCKVRKYLLRTPAEHLILDEDRQLKHLKACIVVVVVLMKLIIS